MSYVEDESALEHRRCGEDAVWEARKERVARKAARHGVRLTRGEVVHVLALAYDEAYANTLAEREQTRRLYPGDDLPYLGDPKRLFWIEPPPGLASDDTPFVPNPRFCKHGLCFPVYEDDMDEVHDVTLWRRVAQFEQEQTAIFYAGQPRDEDDIPF